MFLDIGVGMLLAVCVGLLFGTEPSGQLLAVGIAGALAPDIDFLVWFVRQRGRINEWAHRHHDILHYPLIFIPVGYLLVGSWLGNIAGALFAASVFLHFVHDSLFPGWGIRWLWPFDRRYYLFWRLEADQPRKLHSWSRAEQNEITHRYGDPGWLKKQYGQPGMFLAIEFGILAIGATATAIWFLSA